MSGRLRGFLGEVLQRYFGAEVESSSRIPRAEVEKLLTDDGQRRLELAEGAAAHWGRAEIGGEVEIVSERFIITPRGMLYVARLGYGYERSPPVSLLCGDTARVVRSDRRPGTRHKSPAALGGRG